MRTTNLLRVILVTCGLLRVCYILFTGLDAPVTGDGPAYMTAAEFITRGIYPPQWNITRPPLYPLLIASLWSFGENLPAAMRFLQSILDAFGCFFLVRICQQLFNDRVALLAAGIYAFNPYFVFQTAAIQTETFYQFLMILACFLFIRSWSAKQSAAYKLGSGIFLGLSALTRPQSLLLVVLLACITAYKVKPGGFRAAIWIVFGASLAVAPWTVRNAIRHGEFIPVTEGAGFTFWLGNNRALLEKFRTKEYSEFQKIDKRVIFEDAVRLRKPFENASPKKRDEEFFRLGFAAIKDLGWDYPKLLAWKLSVYFRPTLSAQGYGKKLALTLLIFPGSVLMLGFGIFINTLFRPPPNLIPFIGFTFCCFLTGLALALLFQSQLRFRVPLLDPWLIVLGAWKISAWKASA